jgi:hypothetical protein
MSRLNSLDLIEECLENIYHLRKQNLLNKTYKTSSLRRTHGRLLL